MISWRANTRSRWSSRRARRRSARRCIGPKAKKDSNGRADVPKAHRALVPLWWLDGEMAKDVWICETPAAFADDVFALLKAEDGAKITNLRTTCESYFGFARATLDALEREAGDERRRWNR